MKIKKTTERVNIDEPLLEWGSGKGKWLDIGQKESDKQQEHAFICNYKPDAPERTWSGPFGETLVRSLLDRNNILILEPRELNVEGTVIQPDIETDTCFIEIKTRNYTTSGTVGDKIFAAPHKYREVCEKYKKPIYVVLVGYQEVEARIKIGLFEDNAKKQHDFWWNEYKVKFVCFSDIVNGRFTFPSV